MPWSLNHLLLGIALAGFWLLLSGHYTPLLLSFGLVSVLGVVWLCQRIASFDREAPKLQLTLRVIAYLPWLAWEIIKSNIDVARIVLSPKPQISPTIFKTRALQKGDITRVIYANSITLTPGTVTIEQEGDVLTVHALTVAGAQAVLSGEMNRRVAELDPPQYRDPQDAEAAA